MNEAREFLEIAKDFKNPQEIIRESLSNSWDARASKATLSFSLASAGGRKKKIMVEIIDNGYGMSDTLRPDVGSSEIEGFFNLGDSGKKEGSIGSKGHGSKIFYKSQGFKVETWSQGKKISAATEVDPWESLRNGVVPTYRYEVTEDTAGKGTKITIDGFEAKQKSFASLDELTRYIQWYTVIGSFGQYFDSDRAMDVDLKSTEQPTPVTISYGFKFPDEQTDLDKGTASICKILGPKTIDCGVNEEGVQVQVEIVGALLGDDNRDFVPHTYTQMGLWFCKDYIRVERNNDLLEKALGGQYYYRQFLIFANCQQFDLTANRNAVRADQHEYELAVEGIKAFCQEAWESEFVQSYFSAKKAEDQDKAQKDAQKREIEKKEKQERNREDRLNKYKGRPMLRADRVKGAIKKEPRNEAETALLLQAMISCDHPSIDFVIGEYNTHYGVDLTIEKKSKGIPSVLWAELVFSLDKLFQWPHPPEGYHCVICYQLGEVKENSTFGTGQECKLVPKEVRGKYTLLVGDSSIDVYVLRELLG